MSSIFTSFYSQKFVYRVYYISMEKLPDVIIVYGPPLAGKGTQGAFLRKLLPEFFHLDFGTQLRAYVSNNLKSKDEDAANRAKRLHEEMGKGNAVPTPDLRFVVEDSITQALENDKKLLIEGPGRLLEEAEWLSLYMHEKNLTVTIFHLHINLEETLRRAQRRWYCPESDIPFIGYEAAKKHCGKNKPFQRQEDTDPGINMRRYDNLYNNQYAAILQAYQLNALAQVCTIDGKKPTRDISYILYRYLQTFYMLDRKMPLFKR